MGMGITPIAQDAIRYRRAHHYPVLTSAPWVLPLTAREIDISYQHDSSKQASKQASGFSHPPFRISSIQRLQRPAILLRDLKRHPQLNQLDNDVAELLEEDPVILGVPLDMLLEARVLDERHVGRQHH